MNLLIIASALLAATVQSAKLEEVYSDASVVTNVSFDGLLPTAGGTVTGDIDVAGANITVTKSSRGGGEVSANKVSASTVSIKNGFTVGEAGSANGVTTVSPGSISFGGAGKTGITSDQVASPSLAGLALTVSRTNVTEHFWATNNPHGVTAAQTGVKMSTAHKTLYNGVGDSRLKVFDDEASATVNVEGKEATLYTTAYADYLINQKASAKTVSTLSSDIETLKTTVSSNTSAINNRPTTTTLNAYSNELATAISNATPSDYATVKANASSALSTANANKSSISAINSAGYITQAKADAAYYPKASGDAWSSYWDGDDVRVTVTNYDSAVHMPTLYLEQRTNDTASASDDTNAFRVVWKEMTHWDAFLGSTWNWEDATWQGFDEWRSSLSSALDEKADRAWGFYDSHTGKYAPDGYTSISSSNVMICAGASYQKTATATCDIWVLTANEPYEPTGISTNGGFQIKDADGNVQFEIVKGDKKTVKAQANGVSVDSSTTPNTLVVTYNITATEAPTGEVCLELANAQWKAETDSDCPATVTWSGSSGAWVARITPTTSTTRCFFKATYATGGDTYVNNRCAVGMSQLVLDGTTYTLGTATIDGHTVLTLTPAK